MTLLFCNVWDYDGVNFKHSGEENKWNHNENVRVPLLFNVIFSLFFKSCRYFTLHQTPIFLFPSLSPDRVQEEQEQFVFPRVHGNPKEDTHHVWQIPTVSLSLHTGCLPSYVIF